MRTIVIVNGSNRVNATHLTLLIEHLHQDITIRKIQKRILKEVKK